MKRVKNKVAIVTGGASGLGKSSAKLLAREGAKIVVSDIDEEGGKKVVQQIKEDGGEAIFIKQDVAKEDEWKNVIETTLETYGKLHILAKLANISIYHFFNLNIFLTKKKIFFSDAIMHLGNPWRLILQTISTLFVY